MLLPLLSVWTLAKEPRLVPLARFEISARAEIEGQRVGGLSALAWQGGRVLLLSDDRGKHGEPRLFEFEFAGEPPRLNLGNGKLKLLKFPVARRIAPAIDPEGLVRLPSGDLLISSEADTNLKPRGQNRLMRFDPQGLWKEDLPLPLEIQPERTGQQNRGTSNNFGPEGLSLSPDSVHLWMALERPLVQETRERVVRFERFRKAKENFEPAGEASYQLELSVDGSGEILRGVSEILALSEERLLVIERSAIFQGRAGLGFGGGIFVARCEVKKLCEKQKILDFTELNEFRGGKKVPNFEGLAWGPPLKEGGKSILLLSDNDFSEKTPSEIILFQFKETP